MAMLASFVLLSSHVTPDPVLPVGVRAVIRCALLLLTLPRSFVVFRAYVIGVELAVAPSPPTGCYQFSVPCLNIWRHARVLDTLPLRHSGPNGYGVLPLFISVIEHLVSRASV